MKLGDQLALLILKQCPFVEVTLYGVCVSSGFDQRAGSGVSMDHTFPRSLLAAVTLVEGPGLETEGLEPEPS